MENREIEVFCFQKGRVSFPIVPTPLMKIVITHMDIKELQGSGLASLQMNAHSDGKC